MRSPINLIRDLFGPKKKSRQNEPSGRTSEHPEFESENRFAAKKALALFEKTGTADIGLGHTIDKFMQKKKPFLLNRYTVYQLAEDSGIPVSDLTAFINREKSQNFREFINEYRIHYCQGLMDKAPIIKVSLFELSIICGFTSQREFSNSFKKVAGTTFSDYKKKLNRGKRSVLTTQGTLVLLICGIIGLHMARCSGDHVGLSEDIANKPKECGAAWRPIQPASVLLVANGKVTLHCQV